jgi:mono/diheme cytochrome c family protein
VIACLPGKKSTRALAIVLPAFLALAVFSGCDLDGYPQDLTYPARTDDLVVGRADRDVPDAAYDRPGEFPKVIFAYLPAEDRAKLVRDPAKIKPEQRQQLEKALGAIFGTPAHPKVDGGNAETREVLLNLRTTLKLDEKTLADGSALYRQQCLHCHGLTGDGRGATAPWVNPHPRDYRQGVFKFTSSSQSEGQRKPRKEDLVRTIREGINGSSMPSFRLLPDEDIDALASYVIHLSLRGETEFLVMSSALDDSLPGSIDESVSEYLAQRAGYWQAAQTSLIQPEAFPNLPDEKARAASIQRGWKLFIQQGGAGCIGCHTDYGRQAAYKYDYWGTIVRPTDVTSGVYRGGQRPIDLFWRIHSGINGTGMTAFGATLKSDEIWDLVNFLQVLPYPAMRDRYQISLEYKPAAAANAAAGN